MLYWATLCKVMPHLILPLELSCTEMCVCSLCPDPPHWPSSQAWVTAGVKVWSWGLQTQGSGGHGARLTGLNVPLGLPALLDRLKTCLLLHTHTEADRSLVCLWWRGEGQGCLIQFIDLFHGLLLLQCACCCIPEVQKFSLSLEEQAWIGFDWRHAIPALFHFVWCSTVCSVCERHSLVVWSCKKSDWKASYICKKLSPPVWQVAVMLLLELHGSRFVFITKCIIISKKTVVNTRCKMAVLTNEIAASDWASFLLIQALGEPPKLSFAARLYPDWSRREL